MPITLYYAPWSPPARAILLLIKELGLNVELKKVDVMGGETRTEEFLKMNPQHTIPTLDDNGFCLWESRAILAYLVEAYFNGHNLYPTIPRERANINRVLHHDLTSFYENTIRQIVPILRRETTVFSEEMKSSIHEALKKLELFLVRNDWFAGENLTIADISLVPTIAALVSFGINLSSYPRLAEWFKNCKVLKGFEDDQVFAQEIAGYFKTLVTEGL
ncbi:glutathione S-transferase D7-like [Uranotaenia lowii]|uniref:glutathione S-transferase D7-like n=1 Tax=Uranotaenia lowii TaxID=190385 RepID=UPI0024786119|nr:glutathione S-transferase D7-like [Uranotaenia lowii]